jgi:hypothetical protein
MNIKMHRNNFLRRVRIIAMLSAVIFLAVALRAQTEEPPVQGRFLFIFETSSGMKNRVDAVQKALDTMFATSLSGQLHANDSMAVWTFAQDLHPGDFPLQSWNPDDAVKTAAKIKDFVGGQHYAKSARFAALQPLLNQVVLDSKRLTVVIFCSGESNITGVPFDIGINQAFQEKLDRQKTAHQPFVIVLRSQLGQYVNCTLGLPPQPVIFSGFPPLPAPPPPVAPNPSANIPPPAPTAIVPSLIIVGTKIEPGSPPQMATTNPPPVTNQPPVTSPPPAVVPVPPPVVPVVPVAPTNALVAPPVKPAVTNLVAQTVTQTNATRSTNTPVLLAKVTDPSHKNFLIAGAGLAVAAIVLGIILRLRLRRKDSSLITCSMNERR